MRFDDLNVTDVFDSFASIMQEQGNLDKKLTYVTPNFVLDKTEYSEIDISDELKSIAAKEISLYGLPSEDVIGSAHPEGSTKIVDATDGLGNVETLEDSQNKIRYIAEKKTAIASAVRDLSDILSAKGFKNLSRDLDFALAEYVGKTLVKKKTAGSSEVNSILNPLWQKINSALEVEQNTLTNHYRKTLGRSMGELYNSSSSSSLKAFFQAFEGARKHMLKVPEGQSVGEHLNAIRDTVKNSLIQVGKANSLAANKEVDPLMPELVSIPKDQLNQEMLSAQKMLNNLLEILGRGSEAVALNGNVGDKATWSLVKGPGVGLIAGSDFRNYRELLAKLTVKFDEARRNARKQQLGRNIL